MPHRHAGVATGAVHLQLQVRLLKKGPKSEKQEPKKKAEHKKSKKEKLKVKKEMKKEK